MAAPSFTNTIHQSINSILIDSRTLLVLNLQQLHVINNVCLPTAYTVKHGSTHKNREHQCAYQRYYYAAGYCHCLLLLRFLNSAQLPIIDIRPQILVNYCTPVKVLDASHVLCVHYCIYVYILCSTRH